jgi:hypothetical protein
METTMTITQHLLATLDQMPKVTVVLNRAIQKMRATIAEFVEEFKIGRNFTADIISLISSQKKSGS